MNKIVIFTQTVLGDCEVDELTSAVNVFFDNDNIEIIQTEYSISKFETDLGYSTTHSVYIRFKTELEKGVLRELINEARAYLPMTW